MDELAVDIPSLRRRVARIVRRAESNPERGGLLLKDGVGELLAELKRVARTEPSAVLEVLLILLDRLSEAMAGVDDGAGFAASLIPDILDRVRTLLLFDARLTQHRIDHASVVERLFTLWSEDGEGHYAELDTLLLEVSVTPSGECALRRRLREGIREIPLVFPPPRGASEDLPRALLLAERHRMERLLGEILARGGRFEYSLIVARQHFQRTGDALDLVVALRRGGLTDDAIAAARKALASPRSFRRDRLQDLLETMVADVVTDTDRVTRRELERQFIAEPSAAHFAALKRVVPKDQWNRVRGRVLGHLQRHQRSPDLVFQLYVAEGEITEADGLVVVQPVVPDVLVAGAARIQEDHPAIAAGWFLFAAHHRMATRRPSTYPAVVRDLTAVRDLSRESDQLPSYHRALQRFRQRYALRTRLIALLDEAGLGASGPP